ncbi:MAG: hypothetical protein R3C12_22590 [Planctomycetaceae bacterium]|nr:hypothetical protein [Planctomycetaceae bacterium]
MEPEELQSNRGKIGAIAIACLLIAIGVYSQAPEKTALVGALVRVGLLLGAFWLAVPVFLRHPRILRRLPWYLLAGMVGIVVYFKYLFVLIPVFIALAILSMFAGPRRTRPD